MENTKDPNFPFNIGIELPAHLFIPEGASSLDPRAMGLIPVGTEKEVLLEYRVPKGMQARIIAYGIFNDGLNEEDAQFYPEINGVRTLKNHGRPVYKGDPQNPNVEYIMSLGLAPDLSNVSLIKCNIFMKENDVFIFKVTNRALVETKMGARLVGYEWAGNYTGSKSGS
jgi:hypothetical protein